MATNFMNLTLPVPTSTLGPEWATQLNTAIETIDAHDHSSGKGTKIPVAGININGTLAFNSQKASGLLALQLNSQLAALSGAANSNSIHSVNGNLYFTNGSGTAVQITTGGSIVSSPGAFESLQFNTASSDISINSSDNYVFLAVDTSTSRTITLPSASSVASGRIYIIKDSTGSAFANAISIAAQSGDTIDGAATQSVNSNYGCVWVIGNGVNAWSIL